MSFPPRLFSFIKDQLLLIILTNNMKLVNTIVFFLLAVFGTLAITSMWNDSANYDERIHLPAGYSYLTQKNMRLNPEHPPLVKDLAALPLLFMKINFPYQSGGWNTLLMSDINSRTPAWQTDVQFGNDLLYYSGNDAQKMMRYGRIPIILIGILLGFYIWRFTKELWGNLAGIIALTFYSFSPTVLAHARLVTTDIAAAAAFFISFYYLYHWLKTPTKRNLWIFGIVFGLALLTKFSTFLLLPIFGLIVLTYAITQTKKLFWIKKYVSGFIFSLIISYAVVGLVYGYHTWNYPPEKQQIDTAFILNTLGSRPTADFTIWLNGTPYLRAIGEYLLGLIMVIQRSSGGNTTYYLGEVSAAGARSYFPVVYMIKEPLAYILLIFFGLFLALKKLSILRINSLQNNFAETGMILIILVYWAFSINSNLNIGVRHILPTIPFIYALLARQLSNWIRNYKIRKIFIVILMIWAAFSTISVWPSFLSYFNEIAGGPNGGYKWVVDSNLDWGQDILRLARFVEKNNIKEIKMDYFSGAPAEYYIKTAKIESYNREIPQKGWLAVSATIFQGACKGDKVPCSYSERAYTWLDQYKPVAKIGYSIFVYKLE